MSSGIVGENTLTNRSKEHKHVMEAHWGRICKNE